MMVSRCTAGNLEDVDGAFFSFCVEATTRLVPRPCAPWW